MSLNELLYSIKDYSGNGHDDWIADCAQQFNYIILAIRYPLFSTHTLKGPLFSQVHEKLLSHAINTIRPDVSVFLSLGIHFVLTCYAGTILCLMVPCASFTIVSYARVSKINYGNSSLRPHYQTQMASESPRSIYSLSKNRRIKDFFDVRLPKVYLFSFSMTRSESFEIFSQTTQVSDTKDFRNSDFRASGSKNELKGAGAIVAPKSIHVSLWC